MISFTAQRVFSALPLIALAGAGVPFMGSAPATAKANAGTLTCTVSPSDLQSDIAAKATLSCRFDAIAGPSAKLTGVVKRFGVHTERITKLVLVWSVVAPKTDVPIDDLAGKYMGSVEGRPLSSSTAVPRGLMGGRHQKIELRPLTRNPDMPDGWGLSILELELSAVKA